MAISKLQPLIRAPSSTQVLYDTFMPQAGFIVFSQFCKIQSCKHTGWEKSSNMSIRKEIRTQN